MSYERACGQRMSYDRVCGQRMSYETGVGGQKVSEVSYSHLVVDDDGLGNHSDSSYPKHQHSTAQPIGVNTAPRITQTRRH